MASIKTANGKLEMKEKRSCHSSCNLSTGEGTKYLLESLGSCEAYLLWNIALQAIEKLHALAAQLGAENEELYCEVERLINEFNKIESRARHDELTGVLSKLAFDMDFEVFKQNPPYTIVYVDVDNLKYVNDNFGHHVGDAYLREVASLLKSACRATDRIYRVGGDEFVVFVRGTVDKEMLKERIMSRFGELTSLLSLPSSIGLGVSVGVAVFDGKIPLEEVLKQADAKMYKMKKMKSDFAAASPSIPADLTDS